MWRRVQGLCRGVSQGFCLNQRSLRSKLRLSGFSRLGAASAQPRPRALLHAVASSHVHRATEGEAGLPGVRVCRTPSRQRADGSRTGFRPPPTALQVNRAVSLAHVRQNRSIWLAQEATP